MLEIRELETGYGKKQVIFGLSLDVGEGEIVAIIGPNGAGKSTLLKVIAGMLRPSRGRVRLGDDDVTRMPPHTRIRQGLAYLMQGGRAFPSLTVQENLAIGPKPLDPDHWRRARERALGLFPELSALLLKRAGLLSGGQRQALTLAMVFVTEPRVLLLDEPSAGLAPKLAATMADVIHAIREELNCGILLVEQNVRLALDMCDRLCLISHGQVALTGRPSEFPQDVIASKLFGGPEDARPAERPEAAQVASDCPR